MGQGRVAPPGRRRPDRRGAAPSVSSPSPVNLARSRERSSAYADRSHGGWKPERRRRSVCSMRDELVSLIQRRGDEALAGAITAVVLVNVVLVDESVGAKLASAAVAVALGAVAARRARVPLLFLGLLLIFSVANATLPKLGEPVEVFGFFLLLAVYSAAADTSGRRGLIAGGMVFAIYITAMANDPEGIYIEGLIFYALLLGAPWIAGRAVRRRRLSERRLDQEKAKSQVAIAEERARIARELHDVVAHSISVIVLQARGGRRVLQTDPADAREAFAIIERTGHQALEELRRLRGMLRRSDEELAPARPACRAPSGLVVARARAPRRSRWPSKANRENCRRASTSPPTGS